MVGSTSGFGHVVGRPHTISYVSASQESSRSPFLLPLEMLPWQAPEQHMGACGLACRPCRQGQIHNWWKLM